MSLCTLANVTGLLGLTSTDVPRDALIERLIAGVSAQMARAAKRAVGDVEYAAGRIEYLSVPLSNTKTLWLAAFPVVAVTEVIEAVYEDWAGATALTVLEDYQLDPMLGALHRIGAWLSGVRTVRVTYDAGLTLCEAWETGEGYAAGDVVLHEGVIYACSDAIDPSNDAPGDDEDHWDATDEVPVDDDLRDKAAKQAAFYYQRRTQLGLVAAGAQGGSFSNYAQDKLLPDVREAAELLRRRIM